MAMDLIESRSIFSPATGFILRGGFDFSCNPYLGCTFGCTYCYARFLPQNRRPVEDWGKWFSAKRNAVELAQKQAHKMAGKAVYMASVTDPYQPAERSLMLTRGILEDAAPASTAARRANPRPARGPRHRPVEAVRSRYA